MATPTTREEFKDYCLRRLGFPVVDINIDDDQIEDRIDDALIKYRDFHYDGVEEAYVAIRVTEGDMANGYINLASNAATSGITGVTRVMPITGSSISSQGTNGFNIFDINYQIRLNDFYNLLSSSYTYYVVAREHLAMLDMIVTGEIPFTYNRKTDILNIQMDWNGRLNVNDYIVIQAQNIVNPELHKRVWTDTWLKAYATALIKMQWGTNLTKYANYVLPGGLVINGEKIYNDAVAEAAALVEDLRDTYEAPPQMQVG